MESEKGNACSFQKYHPFLIAATVVGGWYLMGEVEKNEKGDLPVTTPEMIF